MDEDALTSPVDAMAPWTIKSFPTATRNKITLHARKEGVTVGQWIERRVSEWEEAGEPTRVSPGLQLGSTEAPALVELVTMVRELATGPDDALWRLARTTVREQLQAFRRPRLSASPKSEPKQIEAPRTEASQ